MRKDTSQPPIYRMGVTLQATAPGFEVLSPSVGLNASAVNVDLQLTVSATRHEVTVSGKALQFTADPVYRQLRSIGLGLTITVQNFTIQDDVATFLFKQGTITFLKPVENARTGAVCVGQGQFSLKLATPLTRAS